MDKPLKIYLGDLTYDTVAVSTESMPLNIALIASYCYKRFGNKIEITLFKYIDDLQKALQKHPPSILGLSNYCWSHNVSKEIFSIFKKNEPNALTIWGGPNFPIDFPSQKKFMDDAPDVDIYVPIDGEVGFSNIIERALSSQVKKIREEVLRKPIDGCLIRNLENKLEYTIPEIRIKNLDEIPSPYTTGLLDKFFDGKLVPMLQTNRGCPFTCTFCTDGKEAVNLVNKFSKERVRSEILYIAKKVPSNTHSLFISDLNFGMIPGDLDTCNIIAETQEKYDYPHKILSTTGKNQKEKIIQSIRRLNGTMALSMSVQSMDEQVLTNIKRQNISVDKMIGLAPVIKEYDLLTTAEVILGLPGEKYEQHLDTLRKLVEARMDDIVVHTCMLLDGSEMAMPEQRKKWKFETKFRMLPRDFTVLNNGKKVCEIEEVIVGSKDMTFEEYLELRMIGFTLWMTNKGIVYDSMNKFLREKEVDVIEIFHQMVNQVNNAPPKVKEAFEKFKNSTIGELYDSPEEIQQKIQDDKEYQKYVDGEEGINVMQYYHAYVLSKCMDDWTEYVISIAKELLENSGSSSQEISEEFNDVANYCRGTSHNPLGNDRMNTNPKFSFKHDITKWLADKSNTLKISECKLKAPIEMSFNLTKEQFKIVQDTSEMYGDSLIGRTKTLKMVSQQSLWRNPST
ncbi:radical SAM protein [Nitrosopumilus cobalaminigenes]|uniref:Radical SAM protein n=1 Tax=Nitrosopumilus cobalaminigenes TaxID=1470066 RepID=A0A7D5LYD5_9ARCH|nr:radical SAM protein [Nitrosopumilus cobalaminigenes]QLH02214.1 radical SAM protein [Nitrosopumilus cobalaminigenes]